jgi:peroxiredoxin
VVQAPTPDRHAAPARVRPRLLAASLGVALAVVLLFVWLQWPNDDGDDGDVDALLTEPGAVVTYPRTGLGNDPVAGEQLPVVTLLDADGNDVSTADLIGEPLVVNLWYTTCAPCAKELPEFAEFDAERDDVRFVGINNIDTVEDMERFAGERGVTYDLLRDDVSEFTNAVGAVAFPITLFVTSDGTIVDQTGPLDADELRRRIEDLMIAEDAA